MKSPEDTAATVIAVDQNTESVNHVVSFVMPQYVAANLPPPSLSSLGIKTRLKTVTKNFHVLSLKPSRFSSLSSSFKKKASGSNDGAVNTTSNRGRALAICSKLNGKFPRHKLQVATSLNPQMIQHDQSILYGFEKV